MKHHRSRSLRRAKVRTPGARLKIVYRPRKPQGAHCAQCGMPLHGVPRARPVVMRTLPKTKKRPERPYGGMLCSRCTRLTLIQNIRRTHP